MLCVKRSLTLKRAASDVAFRYVLNLGAFWMDSRVPFNKFKYVALFDRVSENRLFPYALPCIMTASYCKNEKKTAIRFHPKCLYESASSYRFDWLQEVVNDTAQFISKLLEEKTIYWCAKCETLLFEIRTAAFTACVWPKKFSTANNLFSSSDAITSRDH
jgi:hypothetical protein